MKQELYTFAKYLSVGFFVLLLLEQSGLGSPSSQHVAIYRVFVVTLIVVLAALWVYVNDGSESIRIKRSRRLGRAFVLALAFTLLVTVLALEQLVNVPQKVLLYMFTSVGALGSLITFSGGRQASFAEYGGERRTALSRDRPFFIALAILVSAMFVYHPAGLDDRSLGAVLSFSSLIYYAYATLVSND